MPAKLLDPVARFWSRVDRRDPEGCWPWLGCVNSAGYGQVTFNRRSRGAHTVAYELTHGAVPAGMQLDHAVCDNKTCCNPAHLKPATPRENSSRANSKTHCLRGHELSGDNLFVSEAGNRRCRACNRMQSRASSLGLGVETMAREPIRADRAALLVSSLNRLRTIREQMEAQEMFGSVDAIAEAQDRLRRQLHILAEEGMGAIPLPPLMGLWPAERMRNSGQRQEPPALGTSMCPPPGPVGAENSASALSSSHEAIV